MLICLIKLKSNSMKGNLNRSCKTEKVPYTQAR